MKTYSVIAECCTKKNGPLTYKKSGENHQSNVNLKRQIGRNAYIIEMILHCFEKPKEYLMHIEFDNQLLVGKYIGILFTNTHFLENYSAYDDKSLSDGLCEVMLVRKTEKLQMLAELFQVLKGKKRFDQLSFVEYFSASKIQVQMNETFSHSKECTVEPLRRVRIFQNK